MESEKRSIELSDNPSNLCRVCLTTNQNNQCIFNDRRNDSDRMETFELPEKLRLCGGIEIVENDGLPATICVDCIIKINSAHELRRQCQKADIWLRQLYGKFKTQCSTYLLKTTKDQHCQTDVFLASDLVKVETDATPVRDYISSVESYSFNNECIEEHKTVVKLKKVQYNECKNPLSKQKICTKLKQTKCEKSILGRKAYRTRRVAMFKRVTSMENLKSHKERQRQYIKKNLNAKRDNIEIDYSSSVTHDNSKNSYNCSKCGRCYTTKKSLDRHILTHNEKKFTCEKCNKQFFQLDKLLKHNKLHKVKEKPKQVLCRICNKNFRKTDTMVRHLNVHKRANPKEVLSILKEIRDKRKLENVIESGKNIYEIGIDENNKLIDEGNSNNILNVSKKCTTKPECENLNSYLPTSAAPINETSNSFEDTTVYRCKHCTKRYGSEKSLQKHLLIHVEKKFVCNVCNMKFFRQDRLKSHKNRYGHDEDKVFAEPQRPSDDKSAIKLINSWIREELDSDNEEKGFPCKVCGKSYDTKRSLLKHQANMHDSHTEGCKNCGKTCVCDEKEKDQQKLNERLKPFRCEECDKSFEKEVKLQRHVRTHERAKEQQDANFKRFLCHICSKTFRQNTGLMFHMRTHTGYKPHVCKYCGRGFTSNSNCINHERTHTGDRPFVCHFCSAAFAKSCTLKAHITTHTGEANYHCKTCGKSFRRLKYLKEHRFTHTGEKPYACKICGTAYSHSGSLFVHEKKCKAQYNNYQSSPVQNTQTYSQSQTSSPSLTPIITILPHAHLNVSGALNAPNNKAYVDNIQRMSSQNINNMSTVGASDLHVHANSDMSDVSSAVKNFALIGQMFQS